jgi:CHASE2 domain-containing sensor protein/signal transduction histidine kinase
MRTPSTVHRLTVNLRRLKHSLLRRLPWLGLSIGLIALVTILTLTQSLPRVDRMLQDNPIAQLAHKPTGDIVIVAMDEKSIDAIGRWPWRRALHAEVLRRVAAGEPRCIGLDVLLSEPDSVYPEDDTAMEASMSDSGCVVLPMALQTRGSIQAELLPMPSLARIATAIGHAHVSIDQDGVARSIYLYEGFAGRHWPQFTLALRDAAAAYAKLTPFEAIGPDPETRVVTPSGRWQRLDHEVIVFATGNPAFKTVSYIDVLRGDVPPDTFRNRFVLIGATAAGLGDAYATPGSSPTGLMPGVEIFANMLQNLLSGERVVFATPMQDLAFNLIPLAIALLGLLWLRPTGVVLLIGSILAVRLVLHAARPLIGVQFTPAAGGLGLVLVYPLWSLMRLSATVRFLRSGAEQLNQAMVDLPKTQLRAPTGDFLDRQMAAMSAAGLRLRDLHRFVQDGINQLPDPTIVLKRNGIVDIANLAASRHWKVKLGELMGCDAHELLGDIRWRTNGTPMMPAGALHQPVLKPIRGEGEDATGRILLLRCVPFFDAENKHAGWLVSLVDITEMRHVQGQRDEALRFISHDIREPSASILTTIELARTHPDSFDEITAFERIERHARTGLELADGFVNLARAESQVFRAERLDLVSLLQEAIDALWVSAHKRRVQVSLASAPEEAECIVDRSLIVRTLTNVLSNALKYSPTDGEVLCRVVERSAHWAISVQDQGPGIPIELQPQLFQPFHRLHRESHPDVNGIGLGLLLVRTAVQRHGGSVEIDSAVGAGCTVTLLLPKSTQIELDALAN